MSRAAPSGRVDAAATGAVRAAGADELPVIDIASLASGDPAARRAIADRVATACETVGFFYVTGHAMSDEVMDRAFVMARAFFGQPLAAKRAVAVDGRMRGYRGLDEIAIPGHPPDLKEVFELGIELSEDDPDVLAGKPLHGPNRWPELEGFRPAMEAYFAAVQEVGRGLLPVFAVALDLEEDFFLRLYDRPYVNMRPMRYPPLPADRSPGQHSTAPHTDFGMMTLLAQDAVGGLQLRLRSGEWVAAPHVPGSFVVNIGDLLACWTNDRFASTPHRVMNLSGRDRHSIPTFYNPRLDAVAECLPSCTGPGNPPRYPPMPCGDYIMGKYRSIFRTTTETDA